MPQSASCSVDRILVSLTGDTQLAGAQKYCGTGSLGVTSTGTQIIMGNVPRQVFAVTRFTAHPAYTPSNYDFDIMIVTVSGTIEFNDRVLPVCLPFKFVNNDFAGATVTLLGWGLLFDGGPRARALRKVDLDVLSQSACMRQGTVATDRQMCTYTPGRDACQDDSGGPLLYTDPSTGLLFNIGVISYGHFCASPEPGINTRVTVLLDWIVNNAERYDYCVK